MTVTNLVSLEAKRTDIGRAPSWPLRPMAALERSLEPTQLLADHAEFIATLSCNQQAKRLRQRGAEQHLASFPDLVEWMERPTPTRVTEARRFGSWPFLSWCFVTERLRPDAELLILKGRAHTSRCGRPSTAKTPTGRRQRLPRWGGARSGSGRSPARDWRWCA